MKNLISFLAISLIVLGCNNNEKFTQELWKVKAGDSPYVNREKVIDDLVQNHLKEGMTYNEVLDLLGEHEENNGIAGTSFRVRYIYKEEYIFDIDPTMHYLILDFDESSQLRHIDLVKSGEEQVLKLTNRIVFDTTIINNIEYRAIQTSEKNLFLINDKNDTIYYHSDRVNRAEFLDFNEDGFEDILFHYITNVPNCNDIALFDSASSSFILVEGFSFYPASTRLKGTDFYYSYQRSGCADANWNSDLFYIENFKPNKIGNIYGVGCEDGTKTGIFISKVERDTLLLMEEIPKEAGYFEGRLKFIKEYWSSNYSKFKN